MEKFKYSEIKRYVQLVENSDISELEISEEGATLRIKKSRDNASYNLPAHQPIQTTQFPPESRGVIDMPVSQSESAPAQAVGRNIIEIKSPMVGTFYQAPSPESDPYIQVGDHVKPGQVLCIIEAMKLMNEIESEIAGKIVEICIENAKPVEFEQVMVRIEKA